MKKPNRLVTPFLILIIFLALIFVMTPLGARADNRSGLPQPQLIAPAVLGGSDIQLSSAGASSPRIAASSSSNYIALVYQQSGSIFIRSTKGMAGWVPATLVGSGSSPDLVFDGANTVHVVWAESNNKIQHSVCTLAESAFTQCDSPTTIRSDSGVGEPAIAIDAGGRLHVAWAKDVTPDSSDGIQTALSSDGGDSWPTIQTITVSNPGQPALAAANSFVHLVFVNNSGTDLKYYRSNDTAHSWSGTSSTFTQIGAGYTTVGNPAVAAGGSNVYVVWDNEGTGISMDRPEEIGKGRYYALTGSKSTNDGVSWDTRHITTNHTPALTDLTDKKLSKLPTAAVPPVESALRPSLAITGTNDFVVVWQQRPAEKGSGGEGGENCTSEINYAAKQSEPWTSVDDVLADDWNNYSIMPDIVFDGSGIRHFVFVKAPDSACAGGDSNDYAVYYRGPYTAVQDFPRVFLPVVLKNS